MDWKKILSKILYGLGIILFLLLQYYLISVIQKQKEQIETLQVIQNNNSLAFLDSIKYVSENNKEIAKQLGFVLNLSSLQYDFLKKQGYELKTLQNSIMELKPIIVSIQGNTIMKGDTILHPFKKDTMYVMIDGLSTIFTKNLKASNTKLSLAYKPIPIEMGISINNQKQIMGTVASTIEGIKFSMLNTKVDPSLLGMLSKDEPSFGDKLRLGLLGGFGFNNFTVPNEYTFMFGAEVQYSDYGLLYLKDRFGNKLVFKVSKSLSTLF